MNKFKYVTPLTRVDREALERLVKADASGARVRMRAHSILLSAAHFTIQEICDIYQVTRTTVSTCLDDWEE